MKEGGDYTINISGQEGKRWMEWKNWNPREGKIANKDLVSPIRETWQYHFIMADVD